MKGLSSYYMKNLGNIHFRKFSSNFHQTVSLLSVPTSSGQPHHGLEVAPKILIQHGLLNVIHDCKWNIKHLPEIIITPEESNILKNENFQSTKAKAKNINEIGVICNKAMQQIKEEASTNNFLLILGGDHCIPIGTIPGIIAKRPNTGVVWVDAHADINTPETSGSGNIHGMPLGFLLNLVENANKYPHMEWFQPCLKPEDICYIGLRDLDKPEKEIVKKLGIKSFTMYEVDKYGIGTVMDMVLEHFKQKDNIHLSFDVDGLDPFYAPSTGTRVRGGLTFREGNYICETLYQSKKMTSMELVEVNPSLYGEELDVKTTVEVSLSLIGSALGQSIL